MDDADKTTERERKSESPVEARRSGAFPLALTLALASAMLATPSHAIMVEDTTPLYFEGVSGFGFSLEAVPQAGLEVDFLATALDQSLPAPGPTLSIDQQIGTIHQQPTSPTPEDPAIVDSTWTITNHGSEALSEPLFVFTVMDPLDLYPGEPVVALDAGLMQLLAYSFSGIDYVYGVVQLPDLEPGGSAMFTVRYLVGQQLASQQGSLLLPSLGTFVFASYTVVPEPSTLMLSALGLAVTLAYSRRRTPTMSEREQ